MIFLLYTENHAIVAWFNRGLGYVLKVATERKVIILDDNTIIKISNITTIDGMDIY